MKIRDSRMHQIPGRHAGGNEPGKRLGLNACVALATLGCIVMASPGSAQQSTATDSQPSAAANSDQLQAIVVTAEKRSERAQDVPFSITAYSGDQLVAEGITSMAQVGDETPGVSERNSGPGQTEFEMRGIASSGGQSPTVGYYLDETPLTPPADAQLGKVVIDPSLYDLNRVEILRGPQGTLYGSGSMGGTIKLVTNQPDPSAFAGSAEAVGSGTSGSGANYGANVMLNIPLFSDVAALRIVGTDKYTDGWIDRIVLNPFPLEGNGGSTRGNVLAAPVSQTYQDVNWERLQGGRATLLVQPTDRLSLTAGIFYQRITQGGLNYADNPPGVDAEAHYQPYNIPEPYSDAFNLASLVIKYRFDGAELTSATAEYRRSTHMVEDATEQTQDFFETIIGIPDLPYSAVGPLATYADDWSRQRTEELRLTSTDAGPMQWLVGGFFQDFRSTDNVSTSPPGPIVDEVLGVPSLYNIGAFTDYRQNAGFGEASYTFIDKLKLTGGLRYYSYSTSENLSESGGLPNGSLTPTVFNLPASHSGLNPKLNLSYRQDENLTIYAQAAKGFRPGSGNTPPPSTCPQDIPLQYKPDDLWSYEIGEKAQLFENRLTVDGAIYYENWTGIQQEVAQACGNTYTANAGTAEVRGGELEVTTRVTPELTFVTGAGYTNAKITQTVPGSSFVVGEKVQQVPTWTDTTSLTWRRPITADYDLIARAVNEYVGPMTDVSYTVNNLPGRDLVNLRAGVSHENLTVFLFADNVTDRRYILDNTNAISFNVATFNRVATNQPRTIGVDLAYRFGGKSQ